MCNLLHYGPHLLILQGRCEEALLTLQAVGFLRGGGLFSSGSGNNSGRRGSGTSTVDDKVDGYLVCMDQKVFYENSGAYAREGVTVIVKGCALLANQKPSAADIAAAGEWLLQPSELEENDQ